MFYPKTMLPARQQCLLSLKRVLMTAISLEFFIPFGCIPALSAVGTQFIVVVAVGRMKKREGRQRLASFLLCLLACNWTTFWSVFCFDAFNTLKKTQCVRFKAGGWHVRLFGIVLLAIRGFVPHRTNTFISVFLTLIPYFNFCG